MAPTIDLCGVVAGFEEQALAKDLSAELLDQALEFVAKMQNASDIQADESQVHDEDRSSKRETPLGPEMEASGLADIVGPALDADEPSDYGESKRELRAGEEQPEEAQKDGNQDQYERDEQLEADEEAQPEDAEERISVSSSYEEFCGQQASEMNLRRLKMDALEDLVVCGQSREATESARRLFSCLGSAEGEPSSAGSKRRGGADSLSSRSSGRGEELEDEDDGDHELMAALARHKPHAATLNHNNNNNNNNNNEDDDADISRTIMEEIYAGDRRPDDYGSIKIARRKLCTSACSDCSAGSSSGRPHSSYGSTLVCALSPSRASQASSGNARELSPSPSNEPASYPIDGDEIRHCRAAFRENRRLIEQAQVLALKRRQAQPLEASSSGRLSGCSSQATLVTERTHWADSLRRRAPLPQCSHCHQTVYSLDRLELDFTRAKLNIHRNCFKCQVCHTLLRLETYASIDTKLFCPAHTKLAAPLPTRSASSLDHSMN